MCLCSCVRVRVCCKVAALREVERARVEWRHPRHRRSARPRLLLLRAPKQSRARSRRVHRSHATACGKRSMQRARRRRHVAAGWRRRHLDEAAAHDEIRHFVRRLPALPPPRDVVPRERRLVPEPRGSPCGRGEPNKQSASSEATVGAAQSRWRAHAHSSSGGGLRGY